MTTKLPSKLTGSSQMKGSCRGEPFDRDRVLLKGDFEKGQEPCRVCRRKGLVEVSCCEVTEASLGLIIIGSLNYLIIPSKHGVVNAKQKYMSNKIF